VDFDDTWELEDDEEFSPVTTEKQQHGRPKIIIDTEAVYDAVAQGMNKKEMAETFGVSIPTLNSRIAEIQKKQGLLMQYRALQSLQLTDIQARVLECITDEKIQEAPLRDLVFAYKILKDKELVVDGKPNEIKGLVGYLIQLEKEEAAAADPVELDITPEDHQYTEDGEKLPDL